MALNVNIRGHLCCPICFIELVPRPDCQMSKLPEKALEILGIFFVAPHFVGKCHIIHKLQINCSPNIIAYFLWQFGSIT